MKNKFKGNMSECKCCFSGKQGDYEEGKRKEKEIRDLIARSQDNTKLEYTKEEMYILQKEAITSDPELVKALKSLAKK